jgi:hypothetical protein
MSNALFGKRSYDLIAFALLAVLILVVLPLSSVSTWSENTSPTRSWRSDWYCAGAIPES